MKPKCNAGGRCKGSHPLICESHGCAITKPARKKPGPLSRSVFTHSTCGSVRLLVDLNWSNWFQDRSFGNHYVHVMKDDGQTFHRVYPKALKGYVCTRLAMVGGVLVWLYDRAETKSRPRGPKI